MNKIIIEEFLNELKNIETTITKEQIIFAIENKRETTRGHKYFVSFTYEGYGEKESITLYKNPERIFKTKANDFKGQYVEYKTTTTKGETK